MVELRSRLVVLGTPGLSAVGRDDSAPVVAVDESLRIVGINPQAMVVSMWRGQQVKPSPAIYGAKHSGVKHVNRVRRFGIGKDVGEIPGALAKTAILVHAHPVFAAVVGTVEPAFLGFNHGVDAVGVCARDRDADISNDRADAPLSFQPLFAVVASV